MWVYHRWEAFTASFTILCEISSRYGVLSMLPKGQHSFLCWFPYQKMAGFWSLGFFKHGLLAHVNANFWQFSLSTRTCFVTLWTNIDVENPLMMNHQFLCILPITFSLPLHMSWQRDALARWGANGMPLPPFNQDTIGAACQNADQRHRISSAAIWGVVNLYGYNHIYIYV